MTGGIFGLPSLTDMNEVADPDRWLGQLMVPNGPLLTAVLNASDKVLPCRVANNQIREFTICNNCVCLWSHKVVCP